MEWFPIPIWSLLLALHWQTKAITCLRPTPNSRYNAMHCLRQIFSYLFINLAQTCTSANRRLNYFWINPGSWGHGQIAESWSWHLAWSSLPPWLSSWRHKQRRHCSPGHGRRGEDKCHTEWSLIILTSTESKRPTKTIPTGGTWQQTLLAPPRALYAREGFQK